MSIHTVRETTDFYVSPADSPLPEVTRAEAMRRLLAAHDTELYNALRPMDVHTSIGVSGMLSRIMDGFASLRRLTTEDCVGCRATADVADVATSALPAMTLPFSSENENGVKNSGAGSLEHSLQERNRRNTEWTR